MSNEELVYLYQNGDRKALDSLIEQNGGIIYKLANKFYIAKTNSIDVEDLIQEGFIGLITAADKYKFNIENPCVFITYAVYWIRSKMQRFITGKNTNDEMSLYTSIGAEEDTELIYAIKDDDNNYENIEEKIYIKQLREEIECVMNLYLSLKQRELLKLRYGWTNNKTMTLEEVGEIFNIRGSAARGIEHQAFRKIRNTPWGQTKLKEHYHEKYQMKLTIENSIEAIDYQDRYIN